MNVSKIKSRKGVTLIELTVVIAVILVLISVLFIGAKFYKDSANRSACVINQNAIFKAASAYININGTDPTWNDLTTGTGPLAASIPVCPSEGAGSYSLTVTAGVPAASCSDTTHVE
ncbi:type II secretion system protein [Rubritalea squalenifaciens]|nr:type II secretion system protein [Rubritalea squalenifaciens]